MRIFDLDSFLHIDQMNECMVFTIEKVY